MEQTVEIQNYLKELEKKKDQEEYQKFINSLRLGKDSTIFGPVRHPRYATILLSEFIQYALSLKYYDKNSKVNCYCEIFYIKIFFSTFFALTRTSAYRHLADTTEREKAYAFVTSQRGRR